MEPESAGALTVTSSSGGASGLSGAGEVTNVAYIDGGGPEAEAAARMQRLMAELLPGLPRFIPE